MSEDSELLPQLFSTRQASHALGISHGQLIYMTRNGEAFPSYKIPGERGGYVWTRTEIMRLLDASDMQRRAFRRKRRNVPYPMDGYQIVKPRVRRRTLPPPPT